MVVRFDASSGGTAQYCGKAAPGSVIKIWGFFPFWIGKVRSGLESSQPNPTPANLTVRDGLYIKNDPTISGQILPTVLPWNGDIYVWNDGSQPGENISNIVILDLDNPCG